MKNLKIAQDYLARNKNLQHCELIALYDDNTDTICFVYTMNSAFCCCAYQMNSENFALFDENFTSRNSAMQRLAKFVADENYAEST